MNEITLPLTGKGGVITGAAARNEADDAARAVAFLTAQVPAGSPASRFRSMSATPPSEQSESAFLPNRMDRTMTGRAEGKAIAIERGAVLA